MTAPNAQQQRQQIPLEIVGGNKFGRFDKINDSQTWNFIVSDDWLVPYAGYKAMVEASPTSLGRGLYASTPGNIMVAVIGQNVYSVSTSLVATLRGVLATATGDAWIAENNNQEICITDGVFVYVYNWGSQSFLSSDPSTVGSFSFPFANPGYVSFHDSRLIIANLNTQQWVLSALNNALSWPTNDTAGANQIGLAQSKPGFIQAVVPMPGGGNNVLIFTDNGAESWQDLGLAIFPYQRNSTFSIDYGTLNPASIGELGDFVVWLAANEQSGPVIMYTQGSGTKSISTDGIDFKLSELTDPSNCTGFLFRQDGHLIYQFTFITDNLSYAYDFNSGLFFTVSDPDLNYHIARQVVFFNNDYYFVSLNGGNVYQFGTQYTSAIDSIATDEDEHEIPRIRVTPPLRMPDQRYFIMSSLGFTIENGQPNRTTTVQYQPGFSGTDIVTEGGVFLVTEDGQLITTEEDAGSNVTYELVSEVVDLSISRDGGESYGSSYRLQMNKLGKRHSRFIYQRLGMANDATFQLRFSGWGRFVVTNGLVDMYE